MTITPRSTHVDHREFIRRLEARFPQVYSGIDDIERGLLHCEIAVLARATSRAIESRDLPTATDHFAFMEDVLAQSDPAVENAVYVSYLENLFLGEHRTEFLDARSKLPAGLARAFDQLAKHFDRLADAARDT